MPNFAERLCRLIVPGLGTKLERLDYVDRWVRPQQKRAGHEYVSTHRLQVPGMSMHDEEQLRRVERWGLDYQKLFGELRGDATINTMHRGEQYLHNGYYPTPDAEIYAAMIADFAPDTIVEVGSGFSTRIARKTLTSRGLKTKLVCVDPEPRTDIGEFADSVIRKPVESLDVEDLSEHPRLLFFVDSSHIVRAAGDVAFLFNEVIPALPIGSLVHVHDIFVPYDYPPLYFDRLYTEQYLLQALLSHSTRYHIEFATYYMAREYPEPMRATFGPSVGTDLFCGASFWFRIV